ncbi:HET-domain-containing protein, partial [Imleria badia]
WLCRCSDLHHITCRPFVSEGLEQIKLVDVETREIVLYPPDGCDYIALSYVWGGVEQPSYKLGEVLPTVPATLEDAMVVTHKLGKKHLWVDSLSIDQENSVEKVAHIAVMSAIYSGAWATIICLSGRSAWSGLPRVGALQGVVPQLSYEIWGKRLLSVMPTLDQQIFWSPWATRAWTYQEGLLSPRRLFFTNHQVYFECNSGQCCE